MTTRITKEWLRRRIKNAPDIETEAGLPITKSEVLHAFISDKTPEMSPRRSGEARGRSVPGGVVLGTLLRQLRRRDKMDMRHLANELRVPEDELHAIEEDCNYVPKPRTIHQIAHYYKIAPHALLRISPAATERDASLDEEAIRFAAHSENLSSLSREERKSLNNFIKALNRYKDGS